MGERGDRVDLAHGCLDLRALQRWDRRLVEQRLGVAATADRIDAAYQLDRGERDVGVCGGEAVEHAAELAAAILETRQPAIEQLGGLLAAHVRRLAGRAPRVGPARAPVVDQRGGALPHLLGERPATRDEAGVQRFTRRHAPHPRERRRDVGTRVRAAGPTRERDRAARDQDAERRRGHEPHAAALRSDLAK